AIVSGVDFRESEIEHLDDAARRDLDVGGFEISMGDALSMRSVQCVGDLSRDAERLGEWNVAGPALGQRWSFDQLENEAAASAVLDHAVNGGDIGMIERGQ